jgi:hypothetical protein
MSSCEGTVEEWAMPFVMLCEWCSLPEMGDDEEGCSACFCQTNSRLDVKFNHQSLEGLELELAREKKAAYKMWRF